MTDVKTGGCLCEAVRYELAGEAARTMVCSCKNCQKTSGSALSTIALVARGDLTVHGELKGYEYPGDSGNLLEINFCPNCGSPVLLNIAKMPDLVSIKVGSFDDTSWFKPQVNIWTDSAQDWMPNLSDCMAFDKNPG
jgi:hypothetical protein